MTRFLGKKLTPEMAICMSATSAPWRPEEHRKLRCRNFSLTTDEKHFSLTTEEICLHPLNGSAVFLTATFCRILVRLAILEMLPKERMNGKQSILEKEVCLWTFKGIERLNIHGACRLSCVCSCGIDSHVAITVVIEPFELHTEL